jgi:hypothetical protein
VRLTRTAQAYVLAALGDALQSGSLLVYAGDPPAGLGDTPQAATLLAEQRFSSFTVNDRGELEAGPIRSGQAKATGTPRWFQVRSADGHVIGDGLVGTAPGQMQITPDLLIAGGRVDAKGFVLGWGA